VARLRARGAARWRAGTRARLDCRGPQSQGRGADQDADLHDGASAFRGGTSRLPQRGRRRAQGRAKSLSVLGVLPAWRGCAHGHDHRRRGTCPCAVSWSANWPFRSRNFADGAKRFSRRISHMRNDQTGMPLNVAKILDDAQQREQQREKKAADDWVAEASKRSEEALAKRAAEAKTVVPPDEKAVVEALASKTDIEYDQLRSEVAQRLGIRVGTLDDRVAYVRRTRARSEAPVAIDAAEASAT